MKAKPIDTLRVSDLKKYRVWEFTTNEADETAVRPVKHLPIVPTSGLYKPETNFRIAYPELFRAGARIGTPNW